MRKVAPGASGLDALFSDIGFSSDFPQMTQIDADIISKVQVEICVICVICGQIWVVEIRNPKSEIQNLGAGGQTTVLT